MHKAQVNCNRRAWLRILDDPYLYGYRAVRGPVAAEVVRAYTGDWRWYGYRDGRQLMGVGGERLACQEAMRAATAWLRQEEK